MRVLVTGGAGYIGSFMTRALLADGQEVIVADDLSRGHREMIDTRAKLEIGNIGDDAFLQYLFSTYQFDGVMHFAGFISVAESVGDPGLYFRNNVSATIKLLDQIVKQSVKRFIFSSTGTVYGPPKNVPIPEDHQTTPENPYAESKRMVERILHWYFQAFGLDYVVLRYFNACGAAEDGSLGEMHAPETHIIPNAIHAALGNEAFLLYGDDYNTKDGTCIRDYIHVLDLVEAHKLALKKLETTPGEYIYNVGTGNGFSNKEVIETVKKLSGIDFPVEIKQRRPGDTEVIISDPSKINNELNFSPKFSDLETIITTALAWHKNRGK
jgi:UDP-glucose 4-epimerase